MPAMKVLSHRLPTGFPTTQTGSAGREEPLPPPAPSSKPAINWELLRAGVLPSPHTLGIPAMHKIQARKTNGEGVAFVVVIFVLFAATLWLFHQRRRTAPLSHPRVLCVPCVPHQPHRSRAALHHGFPPGLGPQVPSVQPLAPHAHRALNWALFLSWILPCLMDPNFYSIPETFCSAFPPSSIYFIFHYLLQSPHSQVRRQESSWPRERRKTGWMPHAAISQLA